MRKCRAPRGASGGALIAALATHTHPLGPYRKREGRRKRCPEANGSRGCVLCRRRSPFLPAPDSVPPSSLTAAGGCEGTGQVVLILILPFWGRCPQGGRGVWRKGRRLPAPSAFPGLCQGRHLPQRGRIFRVALNRAVRPSPGPPAASLLPFPAGER